MCSLLVIISIYFMRFRVVVSLQDLTIAKKKSCKIQIKVLRDSTVTYANLFSLWQNVLYDWRTLLSD